MTSYIQNPYKMTKRVANLDLLQTSFVTAKSLLDQEHNEDTFITTQENLSNQVNNEHENETEEKDKDDMTPHNHS